MPHDMVWVAVEGGVVIKPTIRHLPNGTAVCKFGIVSNVNFQWHGAPRKLSMYFTVSTLGKVAETIYPILKTGMPVRVEGDYHDGVFRDSITDEPRIGRIVYATRVKSFVYWQHRKVGRKKDEDKDQVKKQVISDEDLEKLPF